MSGLLFVSLIVAAYWLIAACRRKRPRVRDAAYFHSSGFTHSHSYLNTILNGARLWKR
jgi:hypothetical protein